ncbi:hypothetical protein FRB95_009029 [Tulasnella sp. JGI-2019a]|nr:hypothetical protein FRB93_007388 [Tulasnella sp. JGI-2019a]KAG9026271.1 hypothetical protein FRB95_009029 [Tulasnella sp. JGI-2019a]
MDSPPPAKKRKLEDVTPPSSSRNRRPANWITPSFGAADMLEPRRPPLVLRPVIKPPAFKAPSFHAEPPLAGPSVAPPPLKKPLKLLSNPNRFFKPPDISVGPSNTSTLPLSNINTKFISSLSDQFRLPKSSRSTLLSTPIKDIKPLYPPPPPLPPSVFGSSSPQVSSNVKPLTRTPLTTRLATITTPSKLRAGSDGPSSDEMTGTQTRLSMSIIANQAREHLLKMETNNGGVASYWPTSGGITSNWEEECGESLRGMAISPEKPDRAGKRSGFVRNGLAERASHLISRSQQEFLLWSHDVGRTLIHSAPATRTPPHDLRVSILKILTMPSKKDANALPDFPFPSLPSPYALARCKVTSTAGYQTNGRKVEIVLILFAYARVSATLTAAASSRLSMMVGLEKGREVLLWRPWSEVEIPPVEADDQASAGMLTILCTRFLVTSRP